MSVLNWIDPASQPDSFPASALALRDPDGLLAAGGDLSATRLLAAYRRGIFPWYSPGEPILWWSPDPRAVLFTDELHVSRRLARSMRQSTATLTFDQDFEAVIAACADAPRRGQQGTWISDAMRNAYLALHRLGHAHSVELWRDGHLLGGLYGIAIGHVFFGESMFSRERNASKHVLTGLVQQLQRWGFPLLDCQVASDHLARLGARTIPRREFLTLLDTYCEQNGQKHWAFDDE